MKQISTLLLAFLFANLSIAQQIDISSLSFKRSIKVSDAIFLNQSLSNSNLNLKESSSSARPAPGDTVFYSDFSVSSEWTTVNNPSSLGWTVVTSAAGQSWYFGGSNIASTSGYPAASLDNGDPTAGAVAAGTHIIQLANPLDLSANSFVSLSYEQLYARFEDSCYVEVSTDGATWTVVDDNFHRQLTTATNSPTIPNPETRVINISNEVGGQSQVWVRFRWQSRLGSSQDGITYGWIVDDVLIAKAPDNNLRIADVYTNGTSDSTLPFYGKIPSSQANALPLTFGADVYNDGSLNQTNTVLNVNLNGPSGLINYTSTPVTASTGAAPTKIDMASPVNITQGTGVYTANYYVTSDSTLTSTDDDSASFQFEVTDTIYSYEEVGGSIQDGWSYNPQTVSDYEMGNIFTIANAKDFKGARVFIGQFNNPSSVHFTQNIATRLYRVTVDSTDGSVSFGTPISVSQNPSPTDPANPDQFMITAGMINSWVFFPMQNTALIPGDYMVSFSVNHTDLVDTFRHAYVRDYPYFSNSVVFSSAFSGGFIDRAPAIDMVIEGIDCSVFTPSVSLVKPNCGTSDGSATVVPSGTSGPYIYNWNTGASGATLNNVSSGNYSVTVFDGTGCSQEIIFGISDTGAAEVAIGNVAIDSCFNSGSGSISVTATGGAGPLTYSWNNGQSSSDISGLTSGTYTVTVSDTAGCNSVEVVVVGGPSQAVNVSISLGNAISCFGESDAELSASGTGGTPPYSYTWSTGASGSTISGLGQGNYQVTVEDIYGCVRPTQLGVQQPTEIIIIMGSPTYNINFTEAALNATVSGGTPSYSYSWTGPDGYSSPSPAPTGITANGVYTLEVTDGNGCTKTSTVTISDLVVGISGIDLPELSIFPNPTSGVLNISGISSSELFTINVTNVLGATVLTENIVLNNNTSLDLNSLTEGVYLIQFVNSKGELSYLNRVTIK